MSSRGRLSKAEGDLLEPSIGGPWWSPLSEHAVLETLAGTAEFVDDSFATGERSGMPSESPLPSDAVWLRPSKCIDAEAQLFSSGDALIIQPYGDLDNEGFLSALGAVSTRAELMLRLFHSVANAHRGMYTLNFYAGGAWTPVLVDTLLPCSANRVPVFSSSNARTAYAVPLLEKGYAKLRGGYSRLARDSIADALVALTGGSVLRQELSDAEIAQKAADGELVKELKHAVNAGDVVCVRMTDRRRSALQDMGRPAYGLRRAEYYVVLGFATVGSASFARVHSPWGPAPWTGPWGPASTEWTAEPERASRLRTEPLHSDAPSEFWLPAPLLQLFDERVICRLFREVPQQAALADGWDADTAGGAPREVLIGEQEAIGSGKWATNPQFVVALDDTRAAAPAVEVTVSLVRDMRAEVDELEIKLARARAAAAEAAQLAEKAAEQAELEAAGGLQTPDSAAAATAATAAAAAAEAAAAAAEALSTEPTSVGLHLVRSDARARVWAIQPKALVASAPLSGASEVTLTFTASARYVYTLVPSTELAGEEARFLLRFWCARALTVSKTRPLVVERAYGMWHGRSAGGPVSSRTWNSNPQMWLALPRRSFLLLTLERLDDHSGAPATAEVHERPGTPSDARPPSLGPGQTGSSGALFKTPSSTNALAPARPSSRGQSFKRPGTSTGASFRADRGGRREAEVMEDVDWALAAKDGVGVGVTVLRGDIPVETQRKVLRRPTTSTGGVGARSGSPSRAGLSTAPAGSRRGGGGGGGMGGQGTVDEEGEYAEGDSPDTANEPVRAGTATSLTSRAPSPRTVARRLDDSFFSTAAARDCSRLPHELKLKAARADLVGQVRPGRSRRCTLMLNLDGDRPYVIVPSLGDAGVEARFRLTIYSAFGATITPISPEEHLIAHGRWTEKTSTGCHLDYWSERLQRWMRNSRFMSNPQFQLRIEKEADVRIRVQRSRLTRVADEAEIADRALLLRSTERYYSEMIGLYVFRAPSLEAGERLRMSQKGYVSLSVVKEVPFVPMDHVEATVRLKPLDGDRPYVLIPCVFGAGLAGNFTLEVTSEATMRLHAVDDAA